jgi:hypothetical protein
MVQKKICPHCGEELGNGDEYSLMKEHIRTCNSEIAINYRKARDEENGWG